jgi:hypothetical protein
VRPHCSLSTKQKTGPRQARGRASGGRRPRDRFHPSAGLEGRHRFGDDRLPESAVHRKSALRQQSLYEASPQLDEFASRRPKTPQA